MIATWKLFCWELHTVRLTPFTQTEPFSTVIYPAGPSPYQKRTRTYSTSCRPPPSPPHKRRSGPRALYDMPVQTAVHQHATLQVHLIAHFQVPEVRTFQGLLDSGNRIRIFRHAYHRKANAVVSHALIYFQLIHE